MLDANNSSATRPLILIINGPAIKPLISANGIVNGATFKPGIAPNSFFSILGIEPFDGNARLGQRDR